MLMGLLVYWLGSDLIPRKKFLLKELLDVKTSERKLTKSEWKAVGALAFLCLLNILFWAIYEQQGNTLQLWADDRTDWIFFGFNIPSSWFQSFNPAMIFFMALLLNMFWTRQSKYNNEPSSVTKMGLGSLMAGAAYLLMIAAAIVVPENQRGHVLWLLGTVYVFTLGELYLSPIGLSLVTKVAPKPILSTMMGVWFLSSFFGNYMTGYLGSFYSKMSSQNFFLMLFIMGTLTGVGFFATRKQLEKIIGKST